MLKIYTQLRYIVFLFSCGLFWQGCNVINPHEQTPTYIHIDSFNFLPNPSVLNVSLSHNITCVWVYYNNQNVGVFDLPATFPVMATGTGTLEMFPGIAVGGLNDILAVYPFYEPDTFTFTAQPGKIINHKASTRYYSAAKVHMISDFNFGTNFKLDGGNIPIIVDTNSADVFEGSGSGLINLTIPGVDSSIDSITIGPIPASSAFIEFNYKNTIPFYVGMQSNLTSGISSAPYYLTGIYPSDHWQKFYLNVQDFAAQYPGSTYNLYIKASLTSGTSGRVLLDNVQLITH